LFDIFLHRKRNGVIKHDHTQTAVAHDWLKQSSWNKCGHAAKVTTNTPIYINEVLRYQFVRRKISTLTFGTNHVLYILFGWPFDEGNIITLVVAYGCETWLLILTEIQRLQVFENGVIRNIFDLKPWIWQEDGKICFIRIITTFAPFSMLFVFIKWRKMRREKAVAHTSRREIHI
jgi:hypothetical protein